MNNDIWEKISAELPQDLVASLRTDGLTKVASRMAGVDLGDERTVYEQIGTSLLYRRKEAAAIRDGLMALDALGGAR